MPSLVDGLSSCIWFESGEKRNSLVSILAGLLFFGGWWIIIDVNVMHSDTFNGLYHLCGIIGTLSFFMINSVSKAQMQGDIYSGGCMGPRGARLWIFIGFVLGFASVIAASWILIHSVMPKEDKPSTPGYKDKAADHDSSHWVEVGLFLQNLFIIGSSLLFKFGRIEDQWG